MKGSIATPAGMDDYQVEDDLRTLCRAKEIQSDAKRMKACQEMAKKKVKEMKSVAGNSTEMSDMDEDD